MTHGLSHTGSSTEAVDDRPHVRAALLDPATLPNVPQPPVKPATATFGEHREVKTTRDPFPASHILPIETYLHGVSNQSIRESLGIWHEGDHDQAPGNPG